MNTLLLFQLFEASTSLSDLADLMFFMSDVAKNIV